MPVFVTFLLNESFRTFRQFVSVSAAMSGCIFLVLTLDKDCPYGFTLMMEQPVFQSKILGMMLRKGGFRHCFGGDRYPFSRISHRDWRSSSPMPDQALVKNP